MGRPLDRIDAIDFTKGSLVILMVLYHSLNYSIYRELPRQYMEFLPPSFIMITGFLITQNYLSKYGSDFKGLSRRLSIRSFKVFMIFTLLNIGARIFWTRNHLGVSLDLMDFFENSLDIYLFGSRSGMFVILLPISYILIMSIIILRLQSVMPYFIQLCAITLFTVCVLMGIIGSSIFNLDMISCGLIGIAIGLLTIKIINSFVRSWTTLFSLFVLYIGSLFISKYEYYNQTFVTIIILSIIYAIGLKANFQNWFHKQTILMGKYSLLNYITQILYLNMISSGAAKWNIDYPNIVLIIILIILITWVTVIFVDHARLRYKLIDSAYKMVFA